MEGKNKLLEVFQKIFFSPLRDHLKTLDDVRDERGEELPEAVELQEESKERKAVPLPRQAGPPAAQRAAQLCICSGGHR